jgi:hypothetical protein
LFYKETISLRQLLKLLDAELEAVEKLGLRMIDRQLSLENFREDVLKDAQVYQNEVSRLQLTLERHIMQLRLLQRSSGPHLKSSPSTNLSGVEDRQGSEKEVTTTDHPHNEEEVPKLEYENDSGETAVEEISDKLATIIGDEFFQTRGGLGNENIELDSEVVLKDEQETMFKFVVKELRGKLTDVSAIMKEREKKAKRKMYGDEVSSESEDEEIGEPIIVSRNKKSSREALKELMKDEWSLKTEINKTEGYCIEGNKAISKSEWINSVSHQ